MLDIIIFNVEHGQSIFFYPREQPQYGMFVDCGNTPDFEPIDYLINKGLVYHDGRRYVLGNLTLTNYDQDHFSGLPHLRKQVQIGTIQFSKNLSSPELRQIKEEHTDALDHVCELKDGYTADAPAYQPPYKKTSYYLAQSEFAGQATTNNLSQVVFVEFGGSVICISGDLEADGWERLLAKAGFADWLRRTNVLVTAHHGRVNGYAEEVFEYCSPECVIISDKAMTHGTQEGMSQAYAAHVRGNGIPLITSQGSAWRKVLTTRNDNHIWVRMIPGGGREYRTLTD
ncbi:MAG: hypothetical protein AB7P08_06185 [Burkholderiales bacterium]